MKAFALRLSLFIATVGILPATYAYAQEPLAEPGYDDEEFNPSPADVREMVEDDSLEYDDAQPGELPMPGRSAAPIQKQVPEVINGGEVIKPAPEMTEETSDCESCNEGASCDLGCDDCMECADDEIHRLFDGCCCLQRCGLNIHGWVAQGFTANPDSPRDNFNGPVTFNDRANEYQPNQVYAIIEDPIDTDECCWDLGGRVDLLYGTDHRFTLARGLDAERSDGSPKWNTNRFYGLAMPQAYGEFGYNNFSLKVGHFYTIIGYEVVTAPDNFFYSHAYTMQYGEPFTHTGALGTYKVNDQLSFSAGYTNGWDTFDDVNTDQSFLGGVTFSSSDESQKLALAITSGDEPSFDGEVDNRTMYSIVYTSVLSDRLTYVLQHDNGIQTEAADQGTNDAEWYGINQYLIYQINCCWSAGIRAEWFRDDDGTRVFPAGDFGDNDTGVNSNVASAGGFEGNFFETSIGLNYRPSANLKIRPELRYDVFDGRATGGVRPYDGGTQNDQFLAAFDVVYLW